MRGWYGESARHSLAARGISTYLYHGTTTVPFQNIKERGLDPKNPIRFFETGDHIYFMEDPESAMGWSDINMPRFRSPYLERAYEGLTEKEISQVKPVLLRVKRKDIEDLGGNIQELGWEELVGGNEVRVDVKIPPEYIEIYDDETEDWIPVRRVSG